jgi:hypothetical protein
MAFTVSRCAGLSRSPFRDSPSWWCTDFPSLSLLVYVVIFTFVCVPPYNTTLSQMPAIKQESSPEPPLAAIAAASSSSLPDTLQRPQNASDHCDVKPSFPPSAANTYIVAKQNQLRSGAHQGSSSRKYKLAAFSKIGCNLNAPAVPVFSRLPSRLGPAIATGHVNNATAATTAFHTITPQHPRSKHLSKRAEHTRHVPQKNRETMDQSSLGSDNGFMDGSGFGTFPSTGLNGMLVSVMTQRGGH